MGTFWRQWCRLCAHTDTNGTRPNIDVLQHKDSVELSATAAKFFSINITSDDDLPQTICPECHQMLKTINAFSEKASRVQVMFAELHNSEELEVLSSGHIKAHYNLDELCDEKYEEITVELIDLERLVVEMMDHDDIKADDAIDNGSGDGSKERFESEECDLSIECDEKELTESTTLPKSLKRVRLENSDEEQPAYTCIKCNRPYKLFKNYRIHMNFDHGIDPDPPKLPMAEKLKYSCPYCDKTFVKQGWVPMHIQSAHMGEGSFVCEGCGKEFKTFCHLKAHQITHSEERPYKCNWCPKSFKNRHKLMIHSDTHKDTKYICPTCGLQLNTLRTLSMHMVVHSDQRLHKCNFCGKKYKRSKALKNHLILHTGLKPYKCDFCDKTFANGSNCRTHKRKTHPEELAAMEAAGTKVIATNIPKLSQLRAVTTNKPEILSRKKKAKLSKAAFKKTMPVS